LPQRGRSSVG